MRLNKRLSICVGISLIMLAGIVKVEGSAIQDEQNLYSDKTELVQTVKLESLNNHEVSNFKKSYSLEEFIKFSMVNAPREKEKTETIFSHLNIQKILNHQELFSVKETLADYNTRVNKVKKMQKLALYINETYDVPLNYSEQIVLSAFLEGNKKDLNPTLVLSVIGVESTFKQYSKSGAGAIGLTQFIPKYHKEKIAKLKNNDVWSINGNIRVGTDVLKEYVDLSKGNIRSALQRYNGTLGDNKFKYSSKVLAKMNKLDIASNM